MAFLRGIRRLLAWALALAVTAALGLAVILPGMEPADLPWAPLDLDAPLGRATAGKIAGLDGTACRALLDTARIAYRTLPAVARGECGYDDAVSWAPGGLRHLAYSPARPTLACPLAASLAVWEREVVQPAAEAIMGSRVVRIDHFGTYACRRMYGRSTGGWSQHAAARAIDVAGFRFADGTRVTVAGDWPGTDKAARFLHAVREGACRAFTTTLSPDYNAAHRDHFHLDDTDRGGMWSACR
ncbi:extensin family protein [uncultured Sphingomonas sp.]|uniref:extensin-like domain-containing protein n=1 Tax=uncultured Sphingomonas sp. TaxID=158754 RepID=UPI0025D186C0|nr:extensin family protein [uncultured Sphingomonas sp.]